MADSNITNQDKEASQEDSSTNSNSKIITDQSGSDQNFVKEDCIEEINTDKSVSVLISISKS
jgi:hypothetical protein